LAGLVSAIILVAAIVSGVKMEETTEATVAAAKPRE
jgi:hypothetical protein